MDREINGQINGEMDGQIDEEMNRQMDREVYEQMDRHIDGQMEGKMDGQIDGQMERQMDRENVRQMDGQRQIREKRQHQGQLWVSTLLRQSWVGVSAHGEFEHSPSTPISNVGDHTWTTEP